MSTDPRPQGPGDEYKQNYADTACNYGGLAIDTIALLTDYATASINGHACGVWV